MGKRKPEESPPAAAWMSTFSDLMNLLLCFFVLLFSMSSVDSEKFEAIADSFAQTFSIFQGGANSIGDGMLISNGVSQLNELDQYINSTGKAEDVDAEDKEAINKASEADAEEEENLKKSEELAEKISEALVENQMQDMVEVSFNSQYVQLTLKGALLFESGSDVLRKESLPIVEKVATILERYAEDTIEIEGHTDNVPIHNSRFGNNNELSSFRALAVFDYLVENTTLQPSAIKHSGRGEYVPVADNATPEGRAKNRRVEIKIYHSYSS